MFVQWDKVEGMNKPYLEVNLYAQLLGWSSKIINHRQLQAVNVSHHMSIWPLASLMPLWVEILVHRDIFSTRLEFSIHSRWKNSNASRIKKTNYLSNAWITNTVLPVLYLLIGSIAQLVIITFMLFK